MSASIYIKTDPVLAFYSNNNMHRSAWQHIFNKLNESINNMMEHDKPNNPYEFAIFKVYEKQHNDLLDYMYSMFEVKPYVNHGITNPNNITTVHDIMMDCAGKWSPDIELKPIRDYIVI